jgi:hypothetical protein
VPQLLSRFSQHGEAHCLRELLDAKQMELARAPRHARGNSAALGTFRPWASGYVPTTMTGTRRICFPACSWEALALPSRVFLEGNPCVLISWRIAS